MIFHSYVSHYQRVPRPRKRKAPRMSRGLCGTTSTASAAYWPCPGDGTPWLGHVKTFMFFQMTHVVIYYILYVHQPLYIYIFHIIYIILYYIYTYIYNGWWTYLLNYCLLFLMTNSLTGFNPPGILVLFQIRNPHSYSYWCEQSVVWNSLELIFCERHVLKDASLLQRCCHVGQNPKTLQWSDL